jgi:hypothetical protein
MAKRPAPPATRAELEETIAQIRAKKADGWTVTECWDCRQVDTPQYGLSWCLVRIALAPDGTDQQPGRYGKGSGTYDPHDEQRHINLAAQKNRSILKRIIKVISVSPARYAGEIRP